jgi:PKD repeat protein
MSLSNASLAEIIAVEFPTWATISAHGTLPADTVWLKAADLMDSVTPGATNVLLGKLTIRGDAEGSCTITAVVTTMDDDDGYPINPLVDPGQLTVSSIVPLPGYDTPPTDPDVDGLYEDLNGNGRKDFDDVVQVFNHMEWIETNEPNSLFDFNGNGRLDFDDIVQLFKEV